MDVISHGLWAGVPFYHKGRLHYWIAFLFGVLPDVVAFAPHFFLMVTGLSSFEVRFGEPPPLDQIHPITFDLYKVTHSAIIFLVIFVIAFFINKRKIFWEMSGWGLHILLDIPTHSYKFFPTPFLWPLSSFKINGFSWSRWWFMLLNYAFIAIVYFILMRRRKKRQLTRTQKMV